MAKMKPIKRLRIYQNIRNKNKPFGVWYYSKYFQRTPQLTSNFKNINVMFRLKKYIPELSYKQDIGVIYVEYVGPHIEAKDSF